MNQGTKGKNIRIDVSAVYQADESDPDDNQFAFRYQAKIENLSEEGLVLLRRNWIITDAEGHEHRVQGPGDISEHPNLNPGEAFEYHSGIVLDSPVSTMHGYYEFEDDNGQALRASIPAFRLAKPGMIH